MIRYKTDSCGGVLVRAVIFENENRQPDINLHLASLSNGAVIMLGGYELDKLQKIIEWALKERDEI